MDDETKIQMALRLVSINIAKELPELPSETIESLAHDAKDSPSFIAYVRNVDRNFDSRSAVSFILNGSGREIRERYVEIESAKAKTAAPANKATPPVMPEGLTREQRITWARRNPAVAK